MQRFRGHAGAPWENGVTSTPSLPDKLGTASSSDAGAADPHETQQELTCCQRGHLSGCGCRNPTRAPGAAGRTQPFPEPPFKAAGVACIL